MPKAYGSSPNTYAYPWEVSVKNRYSKALVTVEYWDNEREAKASARAWKEGDNIVKVRNIHPIITRVY